MEIFCGEIRRQEYYGDVLRRDPAADALADWIL